MKKQVRLNLLAVALVFLLTGVSLYFGYQQGAYASPSEASDSWSMYLHDPQRTGYSSSTAPSTNELKWFYNTTAEATTSPVVANGQVIVGVSNGTVLALNSTTGEKLWSYDTGAGERSLLHSAAIDSGRVYISTHDYDEPYDRNILYCLNASTGELLWQYLASDGIGYSPLVSNGKVFFGVSCSVYCLDADDGSFMWNFTTDKEGAGWNSYVKSALAISDNVLFASSYYGRLYAIDASTGVEIWRSSIDNPTSRYSYIVDEVTPVVYDGKVFYRSKTGVSCVNAADGTPIWDTTESIFDVYYAPAIANGKVFIGTNVGGGGINKFFCFNASTGSSIWNYTIMESIMESSLFTYLSSSAVADGKVFFSTSCVTKGDPFTVTGKFYCLDTNTGSEIWSYQGATGVVFTDPAIADGTVFVSCAGVVYAFGEKPEPLLEPLPEPFPTTWLIAAIVAVAVVVGAAILVYFKKRGRK